MNFNLTMVVVGVLNQNFYDSQCSSVVYWYSFMHASVKCDYFVRDCVIHHVGIIVNRNLNIDQYTIIGVKTSILNGRYSRSQFDLCPQRFLILDDVDQERQMSLCTAVAVHENFRQIIVNASRQK